VKSRAFSFEIKNLVTQFVAAFDDVIIKRYNNQRQPQDQVQVKYVYSPKQRVLYDLANQSQNITLPIVAVSISNVTRDNERVFNKLSGFYNKKNQNNTTTSYYRTPVPINITVNMSILTKFQSDFEQIVSNFIPYNDPYIVLSWSVPENADLTLPQEVRSEVLWDGDIKVDYNTDKDAKQKSRIIGDTTFTIKGWLFKEFKNNNVSNIFYVENNFV